MGLKWAGREEGRVESAQCWQGCRIQPLCEKGCSAAHLSPCLSLVLPVSDLDVETVSLLLSFPFFLLAVLVSCCCNSTSPSSFHPESSLHCPAEGSCSVADFLVGAIAVPFAVVVDGRVETSFHSCLFISCMVIVLTQASVHSLLAIAVDRYLRVYNPLRYRGAVKKQNLCAAVLACWLSASILGLIPMFGWHKANPTKDGNSTIKCEFIAVIDMSYMVNVNFFACILPPTIIMTVLYLFIFSTISKQLRKGVRRVKETRSFYQRERRLANSLALVLVLFAVSWLPLHIMNTINLYITDAQVPTAAFHIGILLSHANSAVNPIVYAFKVPKIKVAYRNIFRRLTSSEQQGEQSSQTLDNFASSNSINNFRFTMKICPIPQAVITTDQDG